MESVSEGAMANVDRKVIQKNAEPGFYHTRKAFIASNAEWREQLIILSEYSVANSDGSSTGDAGGGDGGKRQSSWRVLICKFIWQK